MPTIFLAVSSIMRLHAPTGYLLSFFPAFFGIMLAYEQSTNLLYVPLFFVGSILARGAGCIINDIFDQNLDKMVVRTKSRPLPSGLLNTTQALIILAILLSVCLLILCSLTVTAIATGFIAFFLILLYPLTKRITHFPQVFLGLTFNMGCLIGYAAIKDTISTDILLLYFACGFWTLAYDTIYAFMDIKDDKKINIKSTAIFFEHKSYKLIIFLFYCIFFALYLFSFRQMLSTTIISAIVICFLFSIWIIASLDVKNPANCLYRFKANNYIGFILFLSLLLEKL